MLANGSGIALACTGVGEMVPWFPRVYPPTSCTWVPLTVPPPFTSIVVDASLELMYRPQADVTLTLPAISKASGADGLSE